MTVYTVDAVRVRTGGVGVFAQVRRCVHTARSVGLLIVPRSRSERVFAGQATVSRSPRLAEACSIAVNRGTVGLPNRATVEWPRGQVRSARRVGAAQAREGGRGRPEPSQAHPEEGGRRVNKSIICPGCGRNVLITINGRLRRHRVAIGGEVCELSTLDRTAALSMAAMDEGAQTCPSSDAT